MAADKTYADDYSLVRVPESERRPWFIAAVEWIGISYAATAVLFAVTLVGGLSYWDMVVACLIGNAIMAMLFIGYGTVGAREGLPNPVLASYFLGKNGLGLLSLAVVLSLVGWFAFQSEYMAVGLGEMIPALKGYRPYVALVMGLICMTTAIYGFKALAALSRVAVPVFLAWMLAGVVKALLTKPAGELLNPVPLGTPISLNDGIMVIIGGMAAGAALSPDIFRYSRPDVGSVAKASAVYGFVTALQSPLLALIVNAVGKAELGPTMAFLGPIGILMLFVLGWTTNDNNVYSASLAIKPFMPTVGKWKIATVLGVVGSILAALGVIKYFLAWLTLLGNLMPPVIGVGFTDYYVLPRLGLASRIRTGTASAWHLPGVVSWLAGAVVGIVVSAMKVPVASALVAIIAAGLIYLAWSAVEKR